MAVQKKEAEVAGFSEGSWIIKMEGYKIFFYLGCEKPATSATFL